MEKSETETTNDDKERSKSVEDALKSEADRGSNYDLERNDIDKARDIERKGIQDMDAMGNSQVRESTVQMMGGRESIQILNSVGNPSEPAKIIDNMEIGGSNQPANDEQSILVTAENIKNLLESQNIKVRKMAYSHIRNYPQYIGLLQNEKIEIAVEAALEGILSIEGQLSNNDVFKLYKYIANNKTGIRERAELLIDRVYGTSREEVIDALLGNVEGTNYKIVEKTIMKLNMLINRTFLGGEEVLDNNANSEAIIKKVCSKLNEIMSSTNTQVKKAGMDLCVTIYRIRFEEIYPYLKGVKEIIMASLKTEFDKYPAPKKEVKIGSLNFDSGKWNERLEALNALRESKIARDDPEIISIIGKRINDSNIQVTKAAIECIINGKIHNLDVVRSMLRRFKDKKPFIASLIMEAVSVLEVPESTLIPLLGDKNPEIKLGILSCLKAKGDVADRESVKPLMSDSNPEIRKLAASIVDPGNSKNKKSVAPTADFNDHKRPENKQRQADDAGHMTSGSHNAQTSTVGRTQMSTVSKAQESTANKKRTSTSSSGKPKSYEGRRTSLSTDDFSDKYSFFKEPDWNKRIDFIREAEQQLLNEPVHTLWEFIYKSKESNFNVLQELLRILSSHKDVSEVSNDVMGLIVAKITDKKMESLFLELCRKLDHKVVVNSLVDGLKMNNKGKRFGALLELLIQTVESKESVVERYLQGAASYGMQEKLWLGTFRKRYEDKKKSEEGEGRNENKNESRNEGRSERKYAGMGRTCHDEGEVKVFTEEQQFTDEFLEFARRQPHRASSVLESLDLAESERFVIELYDLCEFPSPYFNTLILQLITRKTILSDALAEKLISHLLSHGMGDEMEMVDKVYPITKTYKILRNLYLRGMCPNECFKEITRLSKRYRNISIDETDEFAEVIKENADFLCMTASAEKMRRERESNDDQIEDSFVITQYPADQNVEVIPDGGDSLHVRSILCEAAVEDGEAEDASKLDQEHAEGKPHAQHAQLNRGINDISSMLEDLSICATPKKKQSKSHDVIRDILAKIVHSDHLTSLEGLEDLNLLIKQNPEIIINSANIIMTSILIQISSMKDNQHFEKKALEVLYQLTQSMEFCLTLHFDTLRAVVGDVSKMASSSCLAADILINLCLNCNLSILKVYLSFLEGHNEIIWKLIWRHSKRVDYSIREDVQELLSLLNSFYSNKGVVLASSPDIEIKIHLTHLKECCAFYSNNIEMFRISSQVKELANLILVSNKFDVAKIRNCLRG